MATTIPTNHAAFTLDDLVAATGGEAVRTMAGEAAGVSTDTRHLRPGNVFVALRGAKYDGHAHIREACDAGAAVVVVSRPVEAPEGVAVVMVGDTLHALGDLARVHKRRWAKAVRSRGGSGLVVAVTGSAGKTTTCRAIQSVLEASAPAAVHGSTGNMNNAVGVPMVLLGLDARHEVAVVELGTSEPGEIAYGASMAEPDVSVLTLVSCAHAEGLGSFEGVAEEKGAIFVALGSEGIAIANADDERAYAQTARTRGKAVLGYGKREGCVVRLVGQTLDGAEQQTLRFTVDRTTFEAKVPLLGAAGAYACAAAVAVDFGIRGDGFDPARVVQGLAAIRAEEKRLRPRALNSGVLVIDDAYNANPASMADSVRTAGELARQLGRRLLLVLGEMRELGQYTDQEHERLGRIAYESGAAKLVAVAGAAEKTAAAASALGLPSEFLGNAVLASVRVTAAVRAGDVILIKGSRGVALERVVEALEAAAGGGS